MGLHRRRWRFRLAAPDLAAVLLMACALGALALWLGHALRPPWEQGPGRVVHAEVYRRPYSRNPLPDHVNLTYQYFARGRLHTGQWDGPWPRAHSPNALPLETLQNLCAKDYPLAVAFDPANPARSALHYARDASAVFYQQIALAAWLAALAYFAAVYPAWKRRA